MDDHTSNGLPEHEGSHGAERNGSPRPDLTSSQTEGTEPLAAANGAQHAFSPEGNETLALERNETLALEGNKPPALERSEGEGEGEGERGRRGSAITRALMPRGALRTAAPASHNEQGKISPRILIISAVALTVVLSVVMSLSILPGQVEIQAGMPATQDILSPAYLNYTSKVLTERARATAMKDPANELWVQDTTVVQRQRTILLNALSVVQSVRDSQALDNSGAKRERLDNMPGIKLTAQQIDLLLGLSDTDYKHWQDDSVLPAFDGAMKDRRLASPSDVEATRSSLAGLLPLSLSTEQKSTAIAFISPLLAVNMHLDEEQTKQRQQDAANNVKPVIQTVQKGEAILRQGELATSEAIEKMEAAGLLSRLPTLQTAVGTTGIVALLMVLLHLYIYRFAPMVWRRQRQLLLVGLLLVFTIVTARLFLPGHPWLPYLLPVAAVSMLVAVLLNANLAVLVTFVMSILLGMTLSTPVPLEMVLYYVVGGLTGILTLTKVERVSTFARTGFYIMVASFLTAFTLRVLAGGLLDPTSIWMLWLAAAVSGFISASIAYAAFSLVGSLFGITTPLHLMELAHPNQPLLRRLMHEAPGTYHHSLVVSNLAEHAAETIGADSLLTRVSAYYHDIGKVEHPYYFIDNQTGRANVHDNLSPWESAGIIARHVEDGVRLGKRHNLPRRVLDAIPQHHGTMLIKYFYYKALQQDRNVDPADFRYPGPKPQTKETAILMLADGVEATVRSMAQSGALDKKPAPNGDAAGTAETVGTAGTASTASTVGATGTAETTDLANGEASESPALYTDASSLSDDTIGIVVRNIINERIQDGQLDECDLTIRDIAHIQEAFVGMLKGIYHPRVVYPEKPIEATAPAEPTGTGSPALARNGNGRRHRAERRRERAGKF